RSDRDWSSAVCSSDLDLAQAFPSDTDTPVVKAVRTSMIYVNEDSMKANGYSLGEISQFVLDYTKAQGASNPDLVLAADRADRVRSEERSVGKGRRCRG